MLIRVGRPPTQRRPSGQNQDIPLGLHFFHSFNNHGRVLLSIDSEGTHIFVRLSKDRLGELSNKKSDYKLFMYILFMLHMSIVLPRLGRKNEVMDNTDLDRAMLPCEKNLILK